VPAIRVTNPHLAFVDVVALFHPPIEHAARHPSDRDRVADGDARLRAPRSDRTWSSGTTWCSAIMPCCTQASWSIRACAPALGFTAYARVVVREDVCIGDRVTLHAGAVVGSDGFGYVPAPDGIRKVPQVGTVIIEDDVEVGANATIDRAALGATRIGRGTKIDNLVMIAHGCVDRPVLDARRRRSGSRAAPTVGHRRAARRAGRIGRTPDDRRRGPRRGQVRHLERPAAGGTYGGIPAIDIILWRRGAAAIKRMSELFRRVRRLEGRAGVDADDE
jgi:hypothetical protein